MLQDKHYDLGRRPATQDDIKFLLATIADVQAISLDVELKTVQIREQYRMLKVHGVQVGFRAPGPVSVKWPALVSCFLISRFTDL